MPEHAKLAPSSAHRWLNCRAALAAEQFEPDKTTCYAEEGTAAHTLAECVLRHRLTRPHDANDGDVRTYLGTYPLAPSLKTHRGPPVSQEMVDKVGEYVEAVWSLAQQPGALLRVEQKCDFSHLVGIPEQFGTADALILVGDELQIHDLKYGFEKVEAFENPQLMMYALGALEQVSLVADIQRVSLFIHQPRLHHVSEYACRIQNLEAFGQKVKAIAGDVLPLADHAKTHGIEAIPKAAFQPGEKTCRWCKRRGKCPAQAEYVSAALLNDFTQIDDPPTLEDALTTARQKLAQSDGHWLGNTLPLLDPIESWCKSVRSAALNQLKNGQPVAGYKLVQGKPGHRSWRNEEAVITLLKEQFRYKKEDVYTRKVISPTQAEKLIKKANPRRWAKIEALIIRPDGKPTLVRESDPKPALTLNAINDFDDLEAVESLT